MTIDLSSVPLHVTLAVGETIAIPLPSYAGSGNAWSATCVRDAAVAQVSIELGGAPPAGVAGDGAAEPTQLMLAEEQAVVRGLASGKALWTLVLARSFGPPVPTATHDVEVTVVAAAGP